MDSLLTEREVQERGLKSSTPLRTHAQWVVKLYYVSPTYNGELETGDNVLTPEEVGKNRDFYTTMFKLPGCKDICLATSRLNPACRRPVSPMNFFYGSLKGPTDEFSKDQFDRVEGEIHPDGKDDKQLPLEKEMLEDLSRGGIE